MGDLGLMTGDFIAKYNDRTSGIVLAEFPHSTSRFECLRIIDDTISVLCCNCAHTFWRKKFK